MWLQSAELTQFLKRWRNIWNAASREHAQVQGIERKGKEIWVQWCAASFLAHAYITSPAAPTTKCINSADFILGRHSLAHEPGAHFGCGAAYVHLYASCSMHNPSQSHDTQLFGFYHAASRILQGSATDICNLIECVGSLISLEWHKSGTVNFAATCCCWILILALFCHLLTLHTGPMAPTVCR